MADADMPAVSVFYGVRVDNSFDLGSFTQVDGLSFEVVVEQREEGGQNRFVHQLPGRFKYPNLKLVRPLDAQSQQTKQWFATMHGGFTRCTIAISAMRPDQSVVTSWTVQGAIPVKWSCASMSVDSPKMVVETIELAHQGFA